VTEEIKVDKKKFDGLLRQMLNTPPLPKSDIPRKRKKKKKK
jgi:hypothetical protein